MDPERGILARMTLGRAQKARCASRQPGDLIFFLYLSALAHCSLRQSLAITPRTLTGIMGFRGRSQSECFPYKTIRRVSDNTETRVVNVYVAEWTSRFLDLKQGYVDVHDTHVRHISYGIGVIYTKGHDKLVDL